MYPGTGDQMDRCFLSLKEPEESARKCHGEVAELREAAGDLLFVPELHRRSRYLCAEIYAHCDYFFKDMAGYILCGRFEIIGSYWGNLGLVRARMGITGRLAEWAAAEGPGNGQIMGAFWDDGEVGAAGLKNPETVCLLFLLFCGRLESSGIIFPARFAICRCPKKSGKFIRLSQKCLSRLPDFLKKVRQGYPTFLKKLAKVIELFKNCPARLPDFSEKVH
jgi:hypothetical protein